MILYLQSLNTKKILEDNKHCKYILIEPKDGDRYAYLSTMLLDSILVDSNKYYPQIFSEKCLYAVDKKVLLGKYIEKSSDKSNDKSSDKSSDKSNDKPNDKSNDKS